MWRARKETPIAGNNYSSHEHCSGRTLEAPFRADRCFPGTSKCLLPSQSLAEAISPRGDLADNVHGRIHTRRKDYAA
jgi:hypothetical protein